MPYRRFRAILPALEYHEEGCYTCDDCHINFLMRYPDASEDILQVMWGIA